jgi:hypothetical protein
MWAAHPSNDGYEAEGIARFDWDDLWEDRAYLVWKQYESEGAADDGADYTDKLFVFLGEDFICPDGLSEADYAQRVVDAFKNSAAITDANRGLADKAEVITVQGGEVHREFEKCVENSMF